MARESTLAELAARAGAGDLDAFERLVREAYSNIAAFLMLIGAPEDDIPDIAQEVFIATYRSIARYDRTRPFLQWVRGIARHVTRKHFASVARRAEHLARFESWVRARAGADGCRAEVLDSGDQEALARCMERLGEPQRRVLELRYDHSLNSTEIADRLRTKAATVRQLLFRARAAIRNCLRSKMGVNPA